MKCQIQRLVYPGGTEAARGRVWCAFSMWARMKGLLGRKGLAEGEWLWLKPCGAVHTVGMRFAIDVVFLDRDQRVVKVARGVKPWRWWVWGGWRARSALEGAAGAAGAYEVGMKVRMEEVRR
ncbi:MAG: DUF192 domain-containing protein [Kiritimatiellia bacterium]